MGGLDLEAKQWQGRSMANIVLTVTVLVYWTWSIEVAMLAH